MTFRGELTLGPGVDLDGAFAAASGELRTDVLVEPGSFHRVGSSDRGTTHRIDQELSAPASMWEPTVALLGWLTERAKLGRIMCVFEGDGDDDQIEVVATADWAQTSEKGPFPTAFIGSLTFPQNTLSGALVDFRRRAGDLVAALPLEVGAARVGIRQRVPLFRKAWVRAVWALEALALAADAGAIDTKIVHPYLPDGEVMRLGAGKRRVVVWE